MGFSPFVGIPWQDRGRSREGSDCWGVVHLIYRERLAIELPLYDEFRTTAEDQAEIERIVKGGLSPWLPIEKGAERAFDCVLVRYGNLDEHIACVVSRGRMLHMRPRRSSAIEHYQTNPYPARITGFFRHEALA